MRVSSGLALTILICVSIGIPVVSTTSHAQKRFTTGNVPPPQFADPKRKEKLAAAFPEIERLFQSWMERAQPPGAVFGVIIDGDLAFLKVAGVREKTGNAPVSTETVFRIASMTKSFTAMAILKLRDEGKLSLEDPVSKYVPELANLPYPTGDAQEINIRHLLTHSEGFPEDNPWGDRQLAQPDKTMRDWMRAGIPFSTSPGTAFEYSNYGFSILGQIVAKASGRSYDDYLRDQILRPLGMTASTLEMSAVPREHIALGYRREGGNWKPEPILAHGSFGAMGGLWTTAHDLARYVTFLMSAFPPRDDSDRGPIKRSSAREMQQIWRVSGAAASRDTVDDRLQLGAGGYGYGLGVSQDCRFTHVVGHGGGLPGYGSLMRWYPEYGVGLIGMANQTYQGFGTLFRDVTAALYRTGAMEPRVVQPSPALVTAQADVSQLLIKWDESLANRLAADNLFLDTSAEVRANRFKELAQQHGVCRPATSITPQNALRGEWRMMCDRGWLNVFITLAPTMPPKVQLISVNPVLPPDAEMTRTAETIVKLLGSWEAKTVESIAAPGFDIEKMRRQVAAAAAWGSCKVGEPLSGNGTRNSQIRLVCDNGPLAARIGLDANTRKLTSLDLVPLREQRCVP